MAVVCALFTMILGLYVWILTLKARGDFAPLFAAQSDQVKSLMQTEVSPVPPRRRNFHHLPPQTTNQLTPNPSSPAAATSTPHPPPS